MTETKREKRFWTIVAAVALSISALTGPANASPPDHAGSHKVTICHNTGSTSNPVVVITVDVAAFDGDGSTDHTLHGDLEYVDGQCGGGDSG